MRVAAKRLIWAPIVAGGAAIGSSALGSWVTGQEIGFAAAAIVLARIAATLIFRLDRLDWRSLAYRETVTATLAFAGGTAIAAAICVTLPAARPGRLVVSELFIHSSVVFGGATIARRGELGTITPHPNATRTLIWGAGEDGRLVLNHVRRTQPLVDVFGWIDDDPVLAELDCDGIPVLGPLESLPLLAEVHRIEAVLVAIPHLSPERKSVAEELARWSGVRIVFAPTLSATLELLEPLALPPSLRDGLETNRSVHHEAPHPD